VLSLHYGTGSDTVQNVTNVETVLNVTEIELTDEGDHDRFTHIVLEGFQPKKGNFIPTGNSVVEGMINSTPVRALCGKVWVPNLDGTKYPLCPTCKEVAESLGWALPS
jgi:hypothetical protein